jgi:hypothetical protein
MGVIHPAAIAMILGMLVLSGCRSAPQSRRPDVCTFAPGMSTDDLARCGCVPGNSPGDGSVMLMSEEARSNTRTVAIINYMCPLGAAGVARVVVMNGIATSVYE